MQILIISCQENHQVIAFLMKYAPRNDCCSLTYMHTYILLVSHVCLLLVINFRACTYFVLHLAIQYSNSILFYFILYTRLLSFISTVFIHFGNLFHQLLYSSSSSDRYCTRLFFVSTCYLYWYKQMK